METAMSNVDVVGTGRRVRKFVGFVGLVLVFATLWFAHMATDTWNAACPPGVTISDINHGAGGPECGKSAFYWFCAAAALLASAWAVTAWLVMWIVSLLTVVKK
jgi:hypothetical protein